VEVQVRYRSAPEPALLRPLGDGAAVLEFTQPQFSIAPGQAAVFYSGEVLLGGGLISSD
jgi:tRNA-specific 2-thiouridylase